MAQPGKELPEPCTAPGCTFGHGTVEQRQAEYAAEGSRYAQLEVAAQKSQAGRDAFNAACLRHAHRHRNVRWRRRGVPVTRIPKSSCWLELLHSIPLNAAKLLVKHTIVKYLPGALYFYSLPVAITGESLYTSHYLYIPFEHRQ